MRTTIDEQGNIQINLIDLLENMEPEEKQKVIEHFAWQAPILEEIKRAVCEEYAAENYNDVFHKLRLAFMQHEDAPELMRYAVKSLLNTIKHLKQREREMHNAVGKWRLWFSNNRRPEEQIPVPYPRVDLEWVGHAELVEFLKSSGLGDVLDAMEDAGDDEPDFPDEPSGNLCHVRVR